MVNLVIAAVLICLPILIFRNFFLSKYATNQSTEEEFRLGDNRVSSPKLRCQLVRGELTQGTRRNTLTFFQSRAEPNGRIRHVFGIDNAFTISDENLAQVFVREASQRIKLKQPEWSDLSDVLAETARRWILVGFYDDGLETDLKEPKCDTNACSPRINITKLVQGLTVVSILKTVCKAEARAHPADSAIINLAQEIHKGWIRSKQLSQTNSDYGNVLSFEENEDLQASLQAVFMEAGRGEDNPLNFVIPAFETIWRVVLRILLEVKFRSAHEQSEWCNAFVRFCSEATKVQFEMRSVPRLDSTTTDMMGPEKQLIKTPSAKDIVMEGLRLYTPTRRIHRGYLWGDYLSSDETELSNATEEVIQGSSGQNIFSLEIPFKVLSINQ